MSKILVIPDVHLKPWMFKQAAQALETGEAERAVCLMDIPDNRSRLFDPVLYEETYDAAIDFQKKYPETLWCYGNHDLSYEWLQPESGFSNGRMHGKIRDSIPGTGGEPGGKSRNGAGSQRCDPCL